MHVNTIIVGTELTMVGNGGKYVVTRIEGDEVDLDHKDLVADINVYKDDLPEMFEGVSNE